jgi:hypothetical protein
MKTDSSRSTPGAVPPAAQALGAIGKTTLVQLAAAAGGQPDTQSGGTTRAPGGQRTTQDIAAEGVAGATARLPHFEAIQRAFGPAHDVSQIGAQVGGDASAATAQLGARAYATGNRVAFGDAPDLHTAAHEAAHTVQQQGGVHLTGDRSQPGDSYERHADAVADRVVSGQSAADLLAPFAGRGGGTRPSGTGVMPKVMAKDDSRDDLLGQVHSALARGDWANAALRINGFSDDDITMLVGKMSGGQRAHVREAAVVAMPGWDARVTGAIDRADGAARGIAEYYARYEVAVTAAKSSGDWQQVAELLNGMGEPDIVDRLGKLDWSQMMAIKAVASGRVIAAVDKANARRAQNLGEKYQRAIAAQDWLHAAELLNAYNDEDIAARIEQLANSADGGNRLGFLRAGATRAMPDHHQRITSVIDAALAAHGETPAAEIPYTASVEIPDVSDDTRQLAGTSLDNFGGNSKIAGFANQLSQVAGARAAARAKKKPISEAEATANKLAALEKGFRDTGPFAITNMGYKTLASYAHDWMSEMRESVDADNAPWHGAFRALKPPTFDVADLVDIVSPGSSAGQKVHPFVNQFIVALGAGFAAGTYRNHGGAVWGPFCVDLFPSIARDDRGLYQREPAMAFFERINATVNSLGGDWASCYNDAAVVTAANQRLGANRITYAGDNGTGNWHGALKLHIHMYLVPPTGGPGSAASAPIVNPATE